MGVIGLTGGIACGKTLASDYLHKLGADVIDTDMITRRLYQPGSALLTEIADSFGKTFLSEDGSLDRKALKAYVFCDEERIERLNQIVQPVIRRTAIEEVSRSKREHQVLVVPLLIETGYVLFCDEIWVMYVDEKMQMERLLRRDGIDRDLAEAIIRRQLSYEEKAKYADCIIDNSGLPLATLKQVRRAYRKFIKNNY